jgi:spore maturation protein SpmA
LMAQKEANISPNVVQLGNSGTPLPPKTFFKEYKKINWK